MTPLTALVTPHAGVEASPAPPPGPGLGHGHSHSPATDLLTVSSPTRLVGVLLVLVDHEGEARNTAGHPDLHQGPVLGEHVLQVPLVGVAIQVGHMQPLAFHLLGHAS